MSTLPPSQYLVAPCANEAASTIATTAPETIICWEEMNADSNDLTAGSFMA
jgi:hypothetical protein